jgi:hypothetical protein
VGIDVEIEMRKFSVTLQLPSNCQSCGVPLAQGDDRQSPGTYSIELPEGDVPTQCSIGNAVRVTLSKTELVVELRHSRSRPGNWALLRHINSDAFGRVRRTARDEVFGGETSYWHMFTVPLRGGFRPWYKTWCAELKFLEVEPTTYNALGGKTAAQNAARLVVKLETLE